MLSSLYRWTQKPDDFNGNANGTIFGFVARKSGSSTDNACHIFAELDPEQPASAIVNFVAKVLIGQGRIMKTSVS
ncbi:Tensin-1 [Lamellibrachia satsuma]|nr:Tensin-1 [Lamellibrachia satsuma]